jgi:hypothetical protein
MNDCIILSNEEFEWISTYPRGCILEMDGDKVVVDISPWHFNFTKIDNGYKFQCGEAEYENYKNQFENDFLYAFQKN